MAVSVFFFKLCTAATPAGNARSAGFAPRSTAWVAASGAASGAALGAALCAALSVTLLAAQPVLAQDLVSITGRSFGSAGLAGFGDTPLAKAPLQASVFGSGLLADAGIQQLSGLVRLDASVSDAYNAEGYWSNLSVRGFTLDNRFNYRRDGLPINAETAIALDNKERLELLKGTTGVQAGTSSPGGMLNLVVKRANVDVRSLEIQFREAGSVLTAVDLGQRFGTDKALGVRLNIAYEQLDPVYRNTRGKRSLAALAVDLQATPDTLLQAEIESSRQSQPSVAGFSLLGNTLPDAGAVDLRRNLNEQPWRQPVVLNGNTASLRLQQRLNADWQLTAHAMQQRLHSDDRTAFPFGVYDPDTYDCPDWCDRYAPDGTFTYWEYISDNEKRTSTAATVFLTGQVQTGSLRHRVEFGLLRSRYQGRFEDQVFDIAGTGSVDGNLNSPRSAGFQDANTNRDEDATEWFARDAVQVNDRLQLWAGLRHTRMQRSSQRTSADSDDSLRPTHLQRSATTPWLAAAYQLGAKTTAYASWGLGLESDVAPNRPRFSNAGESLLLGSRQFEIGLKHGTEQVEAAITLFDIEREQASDIGACGGVDTCRRVMDGLARHRGLEAQWTQVFGPFSVQASALLLQARREGSQLDGVNGQRPVNVPSRSLRLGAEYRPPQVQGLSLQANLSAESQRRILPYDDSLQLPSWTRTDLSLRYRHTLQTAAGATRLTWRVGVDNATNRKAWKESPYQFGHVYLYPITPRTWRVSLQASL